MVKVIDNQIIQIAELPVTGYLKSGESVSGYNLLPLDVLAQEGWLPLEQDIPKYDEETQTIQHDSYTILADKVVETFIVKDIPVEDPIQ